MPPLAEAAAVTALAPKLPDFWVLDPEMRLWAADTMLRRAYVMVASTTRSDYLLKKLLEVVVSPSEMSRGWPILLWTPISASRPGSPGSLARPVGSPSSA